MPPAPEQNQNVPPQPGIKWNTVTWYSGILAVLLFVVLVCGAFFFGIWYQKQLGLSAPDINAGITPTDNLMNSNAATSESWNTFHIAAQLPGASSFDVSYPAQFGDPHTSVEIDNLGHVDSQNNVETIDFYKSSYQPTIDTDKYLTGFFTITQLPQGQTLTDFVNAQLLPTAVNKIQNNFTVDGHLAISQKISSTTSQTSYYVEFKNGLVMDLILSKPRGNETDAERVGILAEAQMVEDKIIQSIKFSN